MPDRFSPWHVYALVDPRSGDVRYVGKSVNVKSRVASHMRDRGSTRKARWIRTLIAENLVPEVLILESGTGDWKQSEIRWIAHYRDLFDLTNATTGGEGLHDPGPETRALISAAQRALWASDAGRAERLLIARSPERRQAISKSLTGAKKSPEHVAKLPQNQAGYLWSDEIRKARRDNFIKNVLPASHAGPRTEKQNQHLRSVQEKNKGKVGWSLGLVMSEEGKRVRSAALAGRKKTPEQRENMRQAALRRWANFRKNVET